MCPQARGLGHCAPNRRERGLRTPVFHTYT